MIGRAPGETVKGGGGKGGNASSGCEGSKDPFGSRAAPSLTITASAVHYYITLRGSLTTTCTVSQIVPSGFDPFLHCTLTRPVITQ
eukprot:scaffold1121_cov129-Isochrysis_galbana.AAC.1